MNGKTLIIKAEVNDFERYYSNKMRTKSVDVESYFIPQINMENLLLKNIFKIIRRIDYCLPIYSLFFNKWWKNIDIYDYIIIFDYYATPQMVRRIKKRNSKANIILWIWNTAPNNINDFRNYCKIFSFDKNSCKKYNLNYNEQFYFEIEEVEYTDFEYDIYFIGSDKGRLTEIETLAKKFLEMGFTFNIEILTRKSYKNTIIKYIKNPQKYEDILRKIKRTKCILEIVKLGQDGLSVRALEALFYNKKLITNNKRILDFDFYRAENIFILGKDNLSDLKSFMNTNIVIIPDDIKKRYSYETWIKKMT